ncbi:MAG: two-component regulator propeller domain-containing protein [Bacteroidales bacterium]|jgi:ligand-binding sensor domain-containing protein
MNLKKIAFFFFSFFFLTLSAQNPIAVGEWRTHFNYTNGKKTAILDEIVFLATSNSLFYTNINDNTIHRLGVLEGLNDIGIQTIEASQSTKTLVICYLNSNIDLYYNEMIFNVPDIAKKQINGDKSIYNIHCEDKYAYLACGFGIVVLDLKKRIILDTWFFSKEGQTIAVNDIAICNDTIYAATNKGIYYNQLKSTTIAQFSSWKEEIDSSVNNKKVTFIESYNNKIYAVIDEPLYAFDTLYNEDSSDYKIDSTILQTVSFVYSTQNNKWAIDSVFGFEEIKNIRNVNNYLIITRGWGANAYKSNNNKLELSNSFSSLFTSDAICNQRGYIYIADQHEGLVCQTSEGTVRYFLPGPATDNVWAINVAQSVLAGVPGSHDDWVPSWHRTSVSIFEKERWNNLLCYESPLDPYYIYDALDILINPNNTEEIFIASYISGLVHIKDRKTIQIYNDKNSPLENFAGRVQVNSLAFDKDFNLWMLNSKATNPLLVRMKDGTWKSFNIYLTGGDIVGKIFIDSRGWIWMTGNRETSLLIYNPNGTPLNTADDRLVKLNTALSETEGAFDYIYSITEDKDGKIWIGTNKGVKVYHNPSNLLKNPTTPPQAVYISEILGDGGDTIPQLLLNQEAIKCIKVDGGNRKWIGTGNAGVFLESEDGKEELLHFTVENSPLLSNSISDIDIDGKTGEVFIATDRGLVSFRYTATDGNENYDEIKIFPNPVREDFSGYISITGLKENSEVKITDAYGGLIYRMKSYGGTASWNGCHFDGRKASTGVYFVFVSDATGKEKKAGKILFIK